ncbi:sulfurtransferase TusA family protein [Paracoccus sp. (in: a-proteobacteria)]|uniref:sulfurtransferase TusA family protein n=1 Tax=Paracoccus sp. TaxID=267 RepID=UPI003A8C5CE7
MMGAIPEIDARGLLCPLPVLRLRKMLDAAPAGARFRLIATDPAAMIDVPHFCATAGHSLIATQNLADGAHVFTVERGLAAPHPRMDKPEP